MITLDPDFVYAFTLCLGVVLGVVAVAGLVSGSSVRR